MPTIPSGAESEVAFLSGITSASKLAGTAFATWKRDTPASYSTTTSYEVKWGGTTPGTSGGTVTYFFDTASNWTTAEKNAISASLSLWSAEANISFSLATSAASANQIFYRDAGSKTAYQTFTSSTLSTVGSGVAGHAISSKIVIDTSQPYWHVGTSFDDAGGYGWQTVVHEIGHMLGLGHGGAYNGNVNASTQQFSAYDTRLWTLMSYIDPNVTSAKYYGSYPVTGTAWGYNSQGYGYEPTTPMILDILAVQRVYGAPTAGPLAAGGVTFGFNSNITGAIKPFFDFTVNQHPVVTLWSGGTNNTLDLSGFTAKSTVNLNPGTFSSVNGMVNDIAIAMDTTIENLIGGTGDDVFLGTALNNTFRGNGGNDTIDGGGGVDTAVFSGLRSQYTLTALSGNGVRVTGPEGTDTLTNVERLKFSDQTVTWPPAGTTSDDFANSLSDTTHAFGVVAVGGTATGTLETAADRDWFSVQLTAGTSYTVGLAGSASGAGTLSDPYLRVRNASGTLVAENNDIAAGSNRDSQVTFTASATGTYYVEAGASGDTLTGTYRVSVGITASAADDFANSLADTSHPLGAVALGGGATGRLESGADRDWFRIQLTAGTTYTVDLTGQQGGGGTLEDPYVRIHDGTGATLFENDDIAAGSNRDSRITFTAKTTGAYYVDAGSYNDGYAGTYTVRLATATVTDDYADSLADTAPLGRLTVGSTATGNLEVAADRDWFAVQLNAGTTYTITLTGAQDAGGTLQDPYLFLHDSTGKTVSENDDTVDGVNVDSQIIYSVNSTGTYYVEAAAYRDALIGTYSVRVTGAATSDDYANSLGDTTHPMGLASVNGSVTGNLEAAGDRDWFQVQLTGGTSYQFNLNGLGSGKGSLEDPYLRVHDGTGAILGENDDIVDGVVRDSQLTLTATTTGTYYLEAGSFEDTYAGTYTLSVASVAASGGNLVDDSITKLYVGYFNRAPDYSGETYWVNQLRTSMKLDQIAQSFSVQAESTALYSFLANPKTGDSAAVGVFVDAVYVNLFNRTSDSLGKAYWVNELMAGAGVGSAILRIINGAVSNDALTVQNKVTVANYYDTETFAHGVRFTQASARDALNGVDSTAASVSAGLSRIDQFIATAPRLELPAASASLVGVNPDDLPATLWT